MTQSLPQVAHEHHERLLNHVDQMPALADSMLTASSAEVKAGLAEMSAFLSETLLPHIDAAERTVYPELERMFQNRHSMAPMRREHEEIRKHVTVLGGLTRQIGEGQVTIGRTLGLRRVMFQLYALLKVHLAEEEAYLRIVEHGMDTEAADVMAAAMAHPVGIG
ncbi:MAG: hemerythrin domain-containing protein [Chloroflexi bacterium]|nr:hemerythrin domain-containing protein [Chloroflexota bacterium]